MNATEYRSVFCGRESAYALQVGKKEQAEFGRSVEIGDYFPIRKPLTEREYKRHFDGEITIGIYVVDEKDKCAFMAIDLDEKNTVYLNALLSACNTIGLTEKNVLIEFSGRKGYHIFIPFLQRIPAKKARALGLIIKSLSKIDVEIFPKQTTTNRKKGFGNLIKIPLGYHKITNKKTYFVGTNFKRLSIKDVSVIKVDRKKVDQILNQFSYALPSETTPTTKGENLLCIKEMSKGIGKGYRDNSAFTLAAYFKQKGDPIGQKKENCLEYLLEWNRRNNPPLSQNVIEDKVNSVYAGGYFVPGCSSDMLSPFCDHRCWKYQVIHGVEEIKDENALSVYDCIPPRGLIKEYIDFATERNASPIEYHLMTILCMLSAVIGNKVWFDLFDDGEKIPNIYTLLIGGSGVGKGSAINVGTKMIRKLNDGINGLLIPHDFLSREALIESLVQFPSGLMVLEEFSTLLAKSKMARYSGVLQFLTQIYDNPGDWPVISKGEGTKVIKSPQLSILGATTAEWISRYVTYEDISGGFLCRYLFVHSSTIPEHRGIRDASRDHIKKRNSLENDLEDVMNLTKHEADLSRIKEQISDFFYRNNLDLVNNPQEDVLRGYWNRLKIYAVKLAILYQASLSKKNPHIITNEAWELAVNLVNYLKEQVKYILKNVLIIGEEYAVANRLLNIIKKAARYGVKRGKLHRLSGINNLRKFDNVIDTLIDQEFIFIKYIGTKKKANSHFYDVKYKRLFQDGDKND